MNHADRIDNEMAHESCSLPMDLDERARVDREAADAIYIEPGAFLVAAVAIVAVISAVSLIWPWGFGGMP